MGGADRGTPSAPFPGGVHRVRHEGKIAGRGARRLELVRALELAHRLGAVEDFGSDDAEVEPMEPRGLTTARIGQSIGLQAPISIR